MKIAAIIVLLAVAVYAKPPGPPKGDDKDGGDMEEKATKVFMSMVKLCMRLSDMADDDDKRSWDAVFGLYGKVCEGIKAALENEVGSAGKDERSGPMPTGMPDFDKSKGKGPKPGSGSVDVDDMDKPDSDKPEGKGKKPKGKGPRKDDDADKRSMKKGDGDDKPTPEEQLLKVCFELAELGKALEGNDKRSLEQALMGMEEVCLAAFVEAKSDD